MILSSPVLALVLCDIERARTGLDSARWTADRKHDCDRDNGQ